MALSARSHNADSPSARSVMRQPGALVLVLAGLFGWIVTLPLFGPVGIRFAGERLGTLSEIFLLAHVAGLIGWGYFADRFPNFQAGSVGLAVAAEALLTLALLVAPESWWSMLFGFMGFVAGSVAVWGRWYATTVHAGWLGRIFAMAAAGANLLKWGFTVVAPHLAPTTLVLFSLLPLGLAGVSLLFLDETVDPSRIRVSLPSTSGRGRTWTTVRYSFFIIFFSVVAGLSYRFLDIAPITPLVKRDLSLLTYMVAVLFSGYLADRHSIQAVAAFGSGLLAVSFLIGAWGQPQAQYLSMGLNGLAFGLLEPAPWLLLASRARPHSAGRWFGWGLNMNAVPIFLGAAVGPLLGQISLERLGLLAAVALLLATWSLYGASDPLLELHRAGTGVPDAGTPVPPEFVPSSAPAWPASIGDVASPAELLRRRYGEVLSGRELEVGQLAISGMATREIALAMYISENTVKTHLKNLFRKTQTANRNELYRRLVEEEREQAIEAQT